MAIAVHRAFEAIGHVEDRRIAGGLGGLGGGEAARAGAADEIDPVLGQHAPLRSASVKWLFTVMEG